MIPDHEQHLACRASGSRACGATGTPTIEDAIGFDALMESAQLCMRNVMWKGTTAWFAMHLTEEVSRLCDELHDGTYQMRKCREFPITYPKPRIISSVAFRDRVVQRSFNDHIIYPIMSRSWVYDNYACQHGKGTDFARQRMRCHLERHLRTHGETGAILQVDVRGYYDNMRHDYVNARFAEKLPAFAADFARDVLAWQYRGDKGYHPGSQMVQIAGVDYLDPLDHHIKEGLGIRGYGRYMDDFVLMHEDVGHLRECLALIADRLACVGLEPHPRKTHIRPIEDGLTFLGFQYRVQGGKVRMHVDPSKVKDQRRHLSGLARLVRDGRMTTEDYLQALGCILEHDGKGCSHALVTRMEEYGMTRLKEALNEHQD